MSSIELNDVTSGYNLGKISDNFDRIERVINEELLHRVNVDDTPNSMDTDIDMNGQHIYNLPKPVLGSSPLRVKDLFGDPDELLGGPDRETIVAVAGQTVFPVSTSYVVGTDSILVFRNGVLQTTEYVETSSTSVTFPAGVDAGDEITFIPVAVTGGDVGSSDGVTSGSNLGTGSGVYINRSGNSLMFKSLKPGTGVTITPSTNEILISADNPTLSASNIGATGEGVFAQKNGNTFEFKKIRAGTNVTVSSDATGVVINSTGGGGGGSPVAVYDNGVLKTSDVASLNFINTTVGVSGAAITVQAPAPQYLNVKDYGAVGDGVTNDSTAVQAAITAAKAANRSVLFPDGTYIISSLGSQNGRVFLLGTGRSILRGQFVYSDSTFPPSADTATPLSPTSPYFSADKISFQSTGTTNYGLSISTIERPYFMSTFSLTNCNFYGPYGLYAKHLVGFQLINCEFNNTVRGARYESCTNGIHVGCRWQNQADTSTWIGKASDFAGSRAPGGENLKFVNCEWAVSCTGIIADQHYFLTLDGCLIDYCGVPLFLSGSKYSKLVNSFFGASNAAITTLSGVTGFVNPGLSGVALYGRPGGSPVGNFTVGVTAHNCEFINYVTGSVNPIVSVDGYVNGTYPFSAEHVSFNNCLFYHPVTHGASTILYLKGAGVWNVVNNRFQSYNVSTSLTSAWIATDGFEGTGHSNDFLQCRQGGSIISSPNEKHLSNVIISASDPGATIGAYGMWIVP